jgi:hypothetical protein
MRRPRCADDFVAIRARVEELRRERDAPAGGAAPPEQQPPPEPEGGSAAARPGIPGWRVARRRRYLPA